MKNQKGVAVVAVVVLVIAGLAATSIMYIAVKEPALFNLIEEKLESIVTPKAPIGDLTPTRDLEGTWVSSLSGKGMQLYGQFAVAGGTTKIYEDGDIELKIDRVENNIASGQIRYHNVCGYGQSIVPNIATVTVPRTCFPDFGFQPVEIRVSATALDFGTINTGELTATMQGSYTTDLMSGSMTLSVPAYGVVKGEFHLMRKR
ncbi:MAG: hypothetical protein WC480_01250 [Patescibacteria group bacterium]